MFPRLYVFKSNLFINKKMVINYLRKKREFYKITKDIKSIKIQGARNVAKAALRAYFLFPSKKSRHKLLSLRPTEPMMFRVLELAQTKKEKEILRHFKEAQEKINLSVKKLIKNDDVIFTHCHSTNVVKSLIFSKANGKKFEVYNTETRPLFQGRKTSKELSRAKIKVTEFVDSALRIALLKTKDTKKVDKVFLGADALLAEGIINKIGSAVICEIAYNNKIPVYIIADSWKYSKEKIEIEERNLNEVWDRAPRRIKIKNPAFEFVPKEYLSGIITEYGLQRYEDFVKKIN